MMQAGIVGYGAYVPRFRIKVEEIASVWGKDPTPIREGLMIDEKSVPGPDEDAATIAVEAARNALARAGIDPQQIGAVYVGSESHPYAVKPTAATVAEAIRATPFVMAADYEFACKAGTAAVQNCLGLVESGMVDYAMGIGSDTSQGRPGDALEYSAAAGGAAMIIGKKNKIASVEATLSYTTDTPDFWRREGEPYPRHGGRFTGEPAYFKHVLNAGKAMLEKMGTKPSDYKYVVFHQPNGKFPLKAGKTLGFETGQLKAGLLVTRLGNTYSGASMLGLAAVLDVAQPGDRIFVVSYGSGSGSDAFSILVEDLITEKQGLALTVENYLARKEYISYGIYAKLRKKLEGI